VGGRYKACLVDSDEYVLRCTCYIDLNPVRARFTDDPAGFRWPSCAALCGRRVDPALTPHPVHLALGVTPADQARAYRAFLDEALGDDDLSNIRRYLQQQRAWGRSDFRTMVEAKTRRFADVRPAHRPPRADSAKKRNLTPLVKSFAFGKSHVKASRQAKPPRRP
jgi:putative transposase